MSRRAMSLMDVLAPPGNAWLKEISGRKADLPAGVKIVRFGDGDDETGTDDESKRSTTRQRERLTA